ncbi:conserved hypothetical protein [Leishmania braziliensis MHOM/BR/75/M2904]|uniref:F-box/LRR-repeat protein 15-like leucin rich repeat domain-containing protein n=2 Tax=Leishmania braziliensis TaxID=5660 RepID=A4H4H0_LEIBR|nr:conserved hypothetical protein [Leishmania braziliensis MHOM/BR/75/M2904]CAJ2466527.1 unnamed protein product [Leishmania braziliensis]CAJ2467122.1 unnamed protein product [Leishmania braziliensis]CAM36960.1 conserved hypothetical protein [Leishmania braziliensis MHOM/BR/75/M2904]SYZ62828.1 hypothetical_protein [Leishmania braziliensis MHOM/BR/75/M2904]
MPIRALPLEGLTSIAGFFDPSSVPLAFTSASPTGRVAGELAAFACPAHCYGHAASPQTPMLSMDPSFMERVAVITDTQQVKNAEWWMVRSRRLIHDDPYPYPLRSVYFCLSSALELSVDLLARVPLCASTVTILNLNARCDSHNHISSLGVISRLVHLRELIMKNTTVLQSTRQLPMVMTPELHAVFRKLRKLVVGDFYLVKHLPLHDLPELEEVDLAGTGVTSDIVLALSSCHRVHTLTLSGCVGIDCFAPLTALTHLSRLDVSHTHLDNAELLHLCRSCSQLRFLALNSCNHITDFSPLALLENLTYLHVARTRFRTSDLERIKALPELEEVHMSSCRVVDTFTPLADLRTLRVLDLRDTWMDDAGIEAIARCCQLKRLNLSSCPAIEHFSPLAQLSMLDELNLSCSPVTDTCLAMLCAFALSLRVILLHGCRLVSDFTPLRKLSSLEEVGVCDTAFNDDALEAVAQCPQLAKLHLHVCTGVTSLSPLAACAHLVYLGIGGTRFSSNSSESECSSLQERGVRLSHQVFLGTDF